MVDGGAIMNLQTVLVRTPTFLYIFVCYLKLFITSPSYPVLLSDILLSASVSHTGRSLPLLPTLSTYLMGHFMRTYRSDYLLMYCLSRLVVFLSVIKINGRTPIRYDSTEKKEEDASRIQNRTDR